MSSSIALQSRRRAECAASRRVGKAFSPLAPPFDEGDDEEVPLVAVAPLAPPDRIRELFPLRPLRPSTAGAAAAPPSGGAGVCLLLEACAATSEGFKLDKLDEQDRSEQSEFATVTLPPPPAAVETVAGADSRPAPPVLLPIWLSATCTVVLGTVRLLLKG